VLVTPGDYGGLMSEHSAWKKATDSAVIVDAILLRKGLLWAEISQCCHVTGGNAVLMKDGNMAKMIAGSEAFVDISKRKITEKSFETILLDSWFDSV
jgi:hypothetical protein